MPVLGPNDEQLQGRQTSNYNKSRLSESTERFRQRLAAGSVLVVVFVRTGRASHVPLLVKELSVGNNATTMHRVYDAFGQGDIPAVLEAMDPGIRWEEPEGMPSSFQNQTGPDAVMQNIFAVTATVFREFSLDVAEIHDAGDVVLAVGQYRAVGAETGSTLTAYFAHIWRFGADGKITGFRAYTDTHLWREVLGENAPAKSAP